MLLKDYGLIALCILIAGLIIGIIIIVCKDENSDIE